MINADTAIHTAITPTVAIATRDSKGCGFAHTDGSIARNRQCRQRLHCKVKREHTIATIDSLQRVDIGIRRGEVLPEEIVALTLAYTVCKRSVVCRFRRNCLRGSIAAAVGIDARNSIYT